MKIFGGLYMEVKERKKFKMTPRFLCVWHVMGSPVYHTHMTLSSEQAILGGQEVDILLT